MNYYERIQNAINYIEENLEQEISIKDISKMAFMSESNLYRMFLAIVGFNIKQYLILRRVNCACKDLISTNMKVIDIAIKYSYDSADAFTRAFKSVTSYTPSVFRQKNLKFNFERIDIMDKYFEIQENDEIEKYPDIKVLKQINKMKVAYYCYYGKNPEDHAFDVVNKWLIKNKIDINKLGCRIFGYNNPDPETPEQQEYGYEVCVTIDEDTNVSDKDVKTKYLQGGLYAVTSIKRGDDLGTEIMHGWKRFMKWLKGSNYIYGGQQYLEEHLGFNEELEHIGGVDLYMPIAKK